MTVPRESFEMRARDAAPASVDADPKRAYRSHLIGPAFAVAALVTPSVIASSAAMSLHHPPGWVYSESSRTGGELLSVQYALLTIGLSVAVASVALALYHRSTARRLLHLFLFSILLELFYRFAYGGAVSPGVLLSVPETSGGETGELLAGHPMLTGSLSLVALFAIYALLVSWRADIRFTLKRCIQAGVVAVTLILASVALGVSQFGFTGNLEPLILTEVQVTFPFDVARALGAVAIGMGDTQRLASTRAAFKFPNAHMVDAVSREHASEIYVVVVGETSRRIDWSLFGYPRATTPRLDAIKNDLILFERVSSNATNTILSVPLALTRATPATREVARSEKSIITLLKQAGFETFWISNQERSDALFNPISQIAIEADHVSFPGDIHSGERGDGFDSNLLTRLNGALASLRKDAKAVIFLHMEGSHFGYKERYPAAFSVFRRGQGAPRALPERAMQLVDEYDNSIYFTDHNIRGVIDRLALCGCKAGMIFFSDHGERLFDNGLTDSDFGHGFPTVSREEIDIPFLVWLSSVYRAANPLLVEHLEANAQSPAELLNLFETITDLTGVDYENRVAELSLFSDRFQSPRALQVLNPNQVSVTLPVEEARVGYGVAASASLRPPPRLPRAAPGVDDPGAR
jgi:glucan phosphoethanolaminetransferase (alkaline phosphatase superfamily)